MLSLKCSMNLHARYLIIVILLLLVDIVGGYTLLRYHVQISERIESYFRQVNSSIRNEHPERFADLSVLKDNPQEWYCNYSVVAHGGGGIYNKTCTDSKEAVQLHYANGTRLFDIDMLFTSDSVLVCRHGWNDNLEIDPRYRAGTTRSFQWDIEQLRYHVPESKTLSLQEFKTHKIHRKLSPMTVTEFLDFMEEHEDVWMLADFGYIASPKYRYLLNHILPKYHQSVKKRIVVTFNTYNDLSTLREIDPEVKVQLKRYGMKTENYYDVAKFCIENDVHAVNLSVYNINDPNIQLFKEHGIHVFIAAVDYMSDYDYCIQQGARGIISNFLFENDLKQK